MSSEESGSDDGIYVKLLPWRSTQFNQLLKTLDCISEERRSAQGQRQMETQSKGCISSHPKPSTKLPTWSISD